MKTGGPNFPPLEEVLEIQRQQIDRYGGSRGLRDPAALESAIATPQASIGGEFLPRSIAAMAAAYLFHICQNHPFIDGNKRAGANAAMTFLFMNNWDLSFGEDELADLVLSVASGKTDKVQLTSIFDLRCSPLRSTLPRL